MRKFLTLVLTTLTGTVLLSSAAPSVQAQAAGTPAGQGRLSMMDRRFVIAAALGNMAEIDLSRMAVQRASRNQVRQFAERMIQEHRQAQQELMALAGSADVTLPAERDALLGLSDRMAPADRGATVLRDADLATLDALGLRHMPVELQEVRELLTGLSGERFDQAYMGYQLKAHARTLADYDLHAHQAGDAGVRTYASRFAPAVRDHLQMARQIVGLPAAISAMGTTSGLVAGQRQALGPAGTPRVMVGDVAASEIILRLSDDDIRRLRGQSPTRAGELAYLAHRTGQPVSVLMNRLRGDYGGDIGRMSTGLGIDRQTVSQAGRTLAEFFPSN